MVTMVGNISDDYFEIKLDPRRDEYGILYNSGRAGRRRSRDFTFQRDRCDFLVGAGVSAAADLRFLFAFAFASVVCFSSSSSGACLFPFPAALAIGAFAFAFKLSSFFPVP